MIHDSRTPPRFYRRRLPRWQPEGRIFFLTWRLAGSLPKAAVDRLRDERDRILAKPSRQGESARDRALRDAQAIFGLTDATLDAEASAGRGPLWLGDPSVARLAESSLHHWDGARFKLHRHAIMPNHAHILLEPLLADPGAKAEESDSCDEASLTALRTICQGIKGYIAREANRLLGRTGAFWQNEGFDHWIRSEAGFVRCVRYIDLNPVKAGLCLKPEDWPWGSVGEGAARGG